MIQQAEQHRAPDVPSETLCPSSALLDLNGWKHWLSPFPTPSWQVPGLRELRLLLAVNGVVAGLHKLRWTVISAS